MKKRIIKLKDKEKVFLEEELSTLLQQENLVEETDKSFLDHLGTITIDFKWLLRLALRPQSSFWDHFMSSPQTFNRKTSTHKV